MSKDSEYFMGVYEPDPQVVASIREHEQFKDCLAMGREALDNPPQTDKEIDIFLAEFGQLVDTIEADVSESNEGKPVRREEWGMAVNGVQEEN